MDVPARPVVAIVGGGFTGAATAFHLARLTSPDQVEIVVIEPREGLGEGLAYSTRNPVHRINVPAAKMTLISGEPDHFRAWLMGDSAPPLDPECATARGDLFPQRSVVGRYVAFHLGPYLASGAIRHVRARVTEIEGGEVRLSDGGSVRADLIVIATSHPLPCPPAELRSIVGTPGVVADPYDPEALDGIGAADDVMIVGTGLTSADVIASLDHRGHRGRILALSRHGYRSQEHAAGPQETLADFAVEPARTTRALLRRIRAAVAADGARGMSWHASFDKLRKEGPAIWATLDQGERALLVRHLRAHWDVHRFRIAPQVADVLRRRIGDRTLRYVAGRLVAAGRDGDRIEVSFRPRGENAIVAERFDGLVVTTGPAHSGILSSNPAIRSLASAGRVSADPLGLGLCVTAEGYAVGRSGEVSDRILVAGPLARGTVGELMGIPEVTIHAEQTARVLQRRLIERSLHA